jgi:hypothetical protein
MIKSDKCTDGNKPSAAAKKLHVAAALAVSPELST